MAAQGLQRARFNTGQAGANKDGIEVPFCDKIPPRQEFDGQSRENIYIRPALSVNLIMQDTDSHLGLFTYLTIYQSARKRDVAASRSPGYCRSKSAIEHGRFGIATGAGCRDDSLSSAHSHDSLRCIHTAPLDGVSENVVRRFEGKIHDPTAGWLIEYAMRSNRLSHKKPINLPWRRVMSVSHRGGQNVHETSPPTQTETDSRSYSVLQPFRVIASWDENSCNSP